MSTVYRDFILQQLKSISARCRKVVKNGQNLVNIVCKCPLTTNSNMREIHHGLRWSKMQFFLFPVWESQDWVVKVDFLSLCTCILRDISSNFLLSVSRCFCFELESIWPQSRYNRGCFSPIYDWSFNFRPYGQLKAVREKVFNYELLL